MRVHTIMPTICYLFLYLITCNVSAMKFEHDEYFRLELQTTKTPKLWLQHIEISISNTLIMRMTSDVSRLIARLFIKSLVLAQWCIPSYQNVSKKYKHIQHIKLRAPCGYLQIIEGSDSYEFYMQTNKISSLQVRFLLFQMDFARHHCDRVSHMQMCYNRNHCPEKLIFCGYRQPWVETYNSHRVFARIVAIKKNNHYNITFVYTSIDTEMTLIYEKHTTQGLIDSYVEPMFITYRDSFLRDVSKWLLVFSVGYQFRFAHLNSSWFSGFLDMYDGFETYHPLLRQKVSNNSMDKVLNITSTYHQTSVHLHANDLNQYSVNRDLFTLKYIRETLVAKYLELDTPVTIHNKGQILNSMFALSLPSGGFPNVSLIVRKFQGWNENHCAFGGYSIRHTVESNRHTLNFSYDQGPFCSGTSESDPFIGSVGPKYIVLGRFHYFLTIYAFSPLYDVDVDIVMRRSECDGLFEPVNMCFAVNKYNYKVFDQFTIILFIKSTNYEMFCSYKYMQNSNRVQYSLEIYNITKCIIFQSVALFPEFIQHYTVQAKMDVNIEAQMAPEMAASDQTGFVRGYFVIGSINLYTYAWHILSKKNKSYEHRHYRKVGILSAKLENSNVLEGVAIKIRVDVIEHTMNCSAIQNATPKRAQEWTGNMTMGLLEISNLCGMLRYRDRSIYIFKFNVHLRDDGSERMFMHINLETRCTANTSLDTKNILSVIAQLGRIYHSVQVINSLIQINQYHLPLAFVYHNELNCEFCMEYRLQQFYVSATIGRYTNVPRSFLLVSPLGYVILKLKQLQ